MPSIKSLLMSRKSSPSPEREGQEADQCTPRRGGSSTPSFRRVNSSGTGSITPPIDNDESILEITLAPNTAPPAPVFTTLLSVHFSPTLPSFGDDFLSTPSGNDTKQALTRPHSGFGGPSDLPALSHKTTPVMDSTAIFSSPLRFHSPTDSVASMASWQSDDSGAGWKEISGNFPLTPSRNFFASMHAIDNVGPLTLAEDSVDQVTPSSIPFPMIDAASFRPPISPRGSSLGRPPSRLSIVLSPCLPTISEGSLSPVTPTALLDSPYRPVTPTPDSLPPHSAFEEDDDDDVFSAMEAEANMLGASGWYSGSGSSFDDSSDCSSEWSCDEEDESWDAVIAPARVYAFQPAASACLTPMTGLVIPTKLGTISEEDEDEEEEEDAHEAVTPVDNCALLPHLVAVKTEAATPALKEALLLGRKLQLAEGLEGSGQVTPSSRSRAGSFSSAATPRAGSPCLHIKDNDEPLGSPFEGWRATFQLGEGHWDE